MVVKRLKEVAAGKREFEQQMEAVGRISPHVNVAPLRAYYFSKDEKLLGLIITKEATSPCFFMVMMMFHMWYLQLKIGFN